MGAAGLVVVAFVAIMANQPSASPPTKAPAAAKPDLPTLTPTGPVAVPAPASARVPAPARPRETVPERWFRYLALARPFSDSGDYKNDIQAKRRMDEEARQEYLRRTAADEDEDWEPNSSRGTPERLAKKARDSDAERLANEVLWNEKLDAADVSARAQAFIDSGVSRRVESKMREIIAALR